MICSASRIRIQTRGKTRRQAIQPSGLGRVFGKTAYPFRVEEGKRGLPPFLLFQQSQHPEQTHAFSHRHQTQRRIRSEACIVRIYNKGIPAGKHAVRIGRIVGADRAAGKEGIVEIEDIISKRPSDL